MKSVKYLAIVLLIFSFSVETTCLAQIFSPEEQHQLDTLNIVINNPAGYDTAKANAYLLLAEILYVSNTDTIIPLCEKAKNIAEKALNKTPISEKKKRKALLCALAGALNNIGYAYLAKGNVPKAIQYYNKAKPISEEVEDNESLFTYYISVGFIYMEQGEIEKALQFFHQSLKIAEKMGSKQNMASSLSNIGYIYEHQDDYEKGLEYYSKSLEICLEIRNQKGTADEYNNIGVVYTNQAEDLAKKGENYNVVDSIREKGLAYQLKSLKIREEIGDKEGLSASFNIIGGIYVNQAEELIKYGGNANTIKIKRKVALDYFNKSLKIREEIEDKDGMTFSLNSMAKIMIAQNQLQQAFEYANRSYAISKELQYPKNIKNAAQLLSEIYKKQNKGTQALEMFELYIIMRDSINNEETQRSTIKQEAKYEYEKQKVIDDLEHDKILAVKQEEKEKQKILTFSIAGILLLVIVFLLIISNRLQVTKKQKQKIELQNVELEIQKKIVEEKNEEITDSIHYARRIQAAILPSAKAVKELLTDSFIVYKPKDIVAGDFYWLEQKNGKILFAVCDCTGHGVPGAMVSVICVNGLNRSVREHGLTDPGEILNKTREIVIQEFEKSEEEVKDGMDIALCSLRFEVRGLRLNNPETVALLQYAGANNPLWIIRKNASVVDEIKPNKQPIGKYSHAEPFTTQTVELEKGDSIYIFSDGYADQFGGQKGKKFMLRSLKQLFLSVQDKELSEQKQIINSTFDDWKGNLNQIDDVCIIGVRI